MTQGIYKITNKENGKVYIGQATDIERRFSEHKKQRKVPIDMYINIFGIDNFDYEIVEECSLEDLDEKEKFYIKEYNSIEEGYNYQEGGYNNSIGEGNGRAILTEEDVIKIRTAYNNHKRPTEFYNKYFKDKITKSQFQRIWQGQSWSHIMPEVLTEENKEYYTRIMQKENIPSLTKDEVLKYRKYYVNHTAKDTYQFYLDENKDKEDKLIVKSNSFRKILTGDVKPGSSYLEVPLYRKMQKTWELDGKPVSTILVSEE